MSEFTICGTVHPRREGVVCTKEWGHEGKHGRRDLPMRCALWQLHLAAAR